MIAQIPLKLKTASANYLSSAFFTEFIHKQTIETVNVKTAVSKQEVTSHKNSP